MDFAERVSLLDRSIVENQCIDPGELHYAHSDDNCLENHPSSRATFIQDLAAIGLPVSPGSAIDSSVDGSSSHGSKPSVGSEYMAQLPDKGYAPRGSAAGRKSAKAALRVRPRNNQHARELERNRHAAANYRSRQKSQLDTLLSRVCEEEDKMLKQKNMVYSLKEELWQLRNSLMARQQMQMLGARNNGPPAAAFPGQTFGFDPTVGAPQKI